MAVRERAGDQVDAVGLLQGTTGETGDVTLAEHWNGSAWQRVLTSNLAGGNILAVGNGTLAPPSATTGTFVVVYPPIPPAGVGRERGTIPCP